MENRTGYMTAENDELFNYMYDLYSTEGSGSGGKKDKDLWYLLGPTDYEEVD